ncbi:MAG: hypothetical protein ACYTGV_19825 [Planctomycetota bacterium]|jgi:hypothetical protein
MRRPLLLLALLAFASAGARAEEERPLPTKNSIILSRGGTTYFVEGRQKIPWGCEISVQKDIKIVGRGKGAVLEVAGSLQVHGITDKEVVIKDLEIEPAARFEEIRLDMVRMYGGGVKNPGKMPVDGRVILENTECHLGVQVDLTMTGGEVRILDCMFRKPVRIRGVPEEGKTKSTLKVDVTSCYLKARRRGAIKQGSLYSGLLGGLFLSGVRNPVVRINRLAGAAAEFVDCPGLMFDGNKVNCAKVVIRHSRNGGFKGTKILKCDFYSDKLILHSPAGKKRERVAIDKCWFLDLAKAKEIHAKVIEDGNDDPDCGVVAIFRKINTRPLELAGKRSG